jgi:hypothetical protein
VSNQTTGYQLNPTISFLNNTSMNADIYAGMQFISVLYVAVGFKKKRNMD